jgi:hypothetical protein
MYTARYSDGQTAIVQTALRFETVVFDSVEDASSWAANYRKAIEALISAPGVDFAFRISLIEKCLKRELFITTSEAREEHLQALAGRFLRLNALVDESVKLCLDQNQHDVLAGSFPKLNCWVRNATYPYNDCQLISDFRLFPLLERLFDVALQRDWDVAVQFNVRRYQPTAEDARSLRKNLAHIDSESGLPRRLTDLQRRVVEKIDQARFLIDQFVGFGNAQAKETLSEQISEEFTAKFGRFGFPCALLDDSNSVGVDEQLSTGFHSSLFLESTPMDTAADAAAPDEIEQLLRWQPLESWAGQLLSNTHIGYQRDFLKRIELKLGDLERALQTRNLAMEECSEFKKALSISRADPPFALVKTRQILEGIVQRVYRDRKREQPGKPLYNMIDELLEDGHVFPRRIASYLHTLRVLGNLVAHGGSAKIEGSAANGSLSETDVELTLLMTLNLVEWYLFDYPVSGPP